LVEDCYSVFEEVQPAKASGKDDEKTDEMGVLKPEAALDLMKKAQGRMEEMEMWLADKPDTTAWNAEAFDKEEMPKMALGALPTEMKDLIGDLLKESEKSAKKADDSATNQGFSDIARDGKSRKGLRPRSALRASPAIRRRTMPSRAAAETSAVRGCRTAKPPGRQARSGRGTSISKSV